MLASVVFVGLRVAWFAGLCLFGCAVLFLAVG